MKNIFYALVFAFGATAFAEQQPVPPQQPEVVEFNTYFEVFVCTKVNQEYSCEASNVAAEKASVKLEKSAHEGLLVGTLQLDKNADVYRHVAELKVMKHTTQQHGTHYGIHIQETFYKSAQQMPSEFDHTYGAIHMKSPADLNEVTFYGRIVKTDTQLFIPVLVVAPASAQPQQRVMKMNPKLF